MHVPNQTFFVKLVHVVEFQILDLANLTLGFRHLAAENMEFPVVLFYYFIILHVFGGVCNCNKNKLGGLRASLKWI